MSRIANPSLAARWPAPGTSMKLVDHLSLSAYWFATNFHWAALLPIIMPRQMERIAPDHPASSVSIVIGFGALVALVVPPVVGAYSDRLTSRWGRRRPFLVAGVFINLIGLAFLYRAGNTRSVLLYLLAYLLVQLGNNIASGAYSGIIPDLVPDNQRGTASGWMGAMTQLGSVVGAVVAGSLMGRGFVRESYIVIGIVLVIFLTATVKGVREAPSDRRPPPLRIGTLLKSLWIDPRKHPDFAWVWVTRALVTMGIWSVQPFLQWYLRDIIEVPNPEQSTGVLLAVALLFATVTGLLGGVVSDKVGRKKVVYVANSTVAIIAVGFLFVHSFEAVLALAAIYGLGFGAYYSVDWALACDVLPSKEAAAKDMGVWHIAMVLPQSLAPFAAGQLLEVFGQTDVAGRYGIRGFTAAFVMAAAFLLLGAVLLRNVRSAR